MTDVKSTWVFGKVASAMGFLTEDQASETASTQEELESEGIALRFGEVLVEGKILEEAQVDQVIAAQGDRQPDPDQGLFGAIAVENGLLDRAALEEALSLQQDLASELDDPSKAPKIGEVLLTEESMDPASVEAVLKVQQRLKIGAFSLTPSKMLLLKKKPTALKVRSPEDALFCKMAVRRQLITAPQVAEILKIQMNDPRPRSVGDIAIELEYMDPMSVAAVQEAVGRKEGVKERRRKHQTTAGINLLKEDREFSQVAKMNGFVTDAQIKKAESLYKVFRYLNYPRNIGEILFDLGHLTTEQVQAVTDIQRLKGAVLPPYRLEEIVISEKEDEAVADLVRNGELVTQAQVTECLKIQRDLRKYGVRRKIGEILLVKGYIFREDLKKKPVLRRDRARRQEARAEAAERNPMMPLFIAGGAAIGVAVIVLFLAVMMRGRSPAPSPSPEPEPPRPSAPERPDTQPEPPVKPPEDVGPPPGKDPAEAGYVLWKGRWIRKEKRKAEARDAFYKALREAVRQR